MVNSSVSQLHDATQNHGSCAKLILDKHGSNVATDGWDIRGIVTIGREGADIVLPVPVLSRVHVRILRRLGHYVIQDLDSRNGTALNGKLLDKGEHALRNNDVIVLAGAVQLRFFDPMATPIAPRIGKLDGLWIDPETHDVWINAALVAPALSAHQFRLLQLLDSAEGAVVTRDVLVEYVWSESSPGGISEDAVDSLVKRLRKRLSEYDNGHELIRVVRGRGLRLVIDL